ncbi:MAG: leucine-rich repeat domain-containing protein, partial [Paludibacteraceae bacterium]|nr:leucine-rich repeat domain-containing protein [Paludibacteraceae bacterium]
MAEIIKQGTCGHKLTWTLDNEGLLTISGEGKMENYGFFDSPFKNTNVTKVEISQGVTSIGESAFSGCKALTSIEIPNSVTSIGLGAFLGCEALTSIEIPNSVTSIGSYAFEGCEALTNINISDGNANYASVNGVLYDKEKKTLIRCPQTKTSIEIPNSVTS